MIPLYLRFIPINVYSVWLASGNFLAWISIIDPGLTIVLQQQVAAAYGKWDVARLRMLIGGGLIICAIIFIIAITFGLICAYYLPIWLNLPSAINIDLIVKAFKLAVIGTSLMLFSFSISSINSGLQGSIGVGLINNGVTVVSIILNIILLNLGFGLMSISISLFFSGICFFLGQGSYLFVRVFVEKIGISFSYAGVKILAKLLSYTFLSRAAGIIANNMDLIFISRIIGPESVAVLALTRKSADISKELINQPTIAFLPAVSHAAGAGETVKVREVLMRLVHILSWMLCLVVGGLITFNESFVRLWAGPQFYAGNTVNLIICCTILFTMASYCLSNLCFALGNIKVNSLVGAVQSLLLIPIIIVGTKYFGLMGAVIAPLLPVLMLTIWYYPRSFSKLLKLSQVDIKNLILEIFRALAVMVFLIILFSWLQPKNFVDFILSVSFYCLSYGVFMYNVSKIFKTEIKGAIQKLKSLLKAKLVFIK